MNDPVILTINGGSSSVKFAVFAADNSARRLASGQIQRVGQPGTVLSASGLGDPVDELPIAGGDHGEAVIALTSWLRDRLGGRAPVGIGHRIVHGGFYLLTHQVITEKVLDALRDATQLDRAHLPLEISLIQAIGAQFPNVAQVACFDTAFFQKLPTQAKLLPLPRKYFDVGIHRFGFHGLSYTYLMDKLRSVGGDAAASGRVILAHLGSGASLAAVKGGAPIDTSMSFTPTAGVMMGTRSGDLDPGVLDYLIRTEHLSADALNDLVNKKSGLLGVSETSSDMRDLIGKRDSDPHAAEAVDLFCYQAKKWIGGFAAALGGVDTIVFAGGIGENSAESRLGICQGLEFLGVEIDAHKNSANSDIISAGKVTVRVIQTDEESIIARIVSELIPAS